jgi:trans-aconitate 2-methyltransferase
MYLDIKRSGDARTMWNPATYLQFANERARPFFDLLSRVQADDPDYVVDLGCGPGNLTALLAARWPAAQVLGVDHSAAMIKAAQAEATEPGQAGRPAGPLAFMQADIRDWQPRRPVDVFTCNAVLQWVPGHLRLLPTWVSWLSPGGWLAFQLPGNFDQPSHTIMRELAASPRWQPLLRDVQLNRQAVDPATYLDVLAAAECEVDAWETTYLHVLPGEDAVLDWYKGSGLRPVLAALTPGQGAEFTAEYGEQIRVAYPPAAYGTVLPFRRVFVVARR